MTKYKLHAALYRCEMVLATKIEVPKVKAEFERWLGNWQWDRFITLATNDPMATEASALQLLRRWDARMNRQAVGPEWHRRRDERLWCFCFLEKADRNAHWHILLRFMTFYPDLIKRHAQAVDEHAERLWRAVKPGGTVKVDTIYDQAGAAEYVVKALGDEVSYSRFVTPDEFVLHPT